MQWSIEIFEGGELCLPHPKTKEKLMNEPYFIIK